MVQNLAQTCHGFAAGMVKFCQRMGWGMLAAVLDHMRDRLEAGARADLLEMAQVAYVKSWTARVLRENGFRSVRALAEADPKDLVPVLMMVGMPSLKSSLFECLLTLSGKPTQGAKTSAGSQAGGEVHRQAARQSGDHCRVGK